LDASAIERVREEAWPTATDPDELHDALLTSGLILESEGGQWRALFDVLLRDRRAARVRSGRNAIWVAAERLPELRVVLPDAAIEGDPAEVRGARSDWTPEDARIELLRSRMDVF